MNSSNDWENEDGWFENVWKMMHLGNPNMDGLKDDAS